MGTELKSKRMISFEISDELREALRIEAFNRGMSISKLIRTILENSVQNPKNADEGGGK